MPIITASINTGCPRKKDKRETAASSKGGEKQAFSFTACIRRSAFKGSNLTKQDLVSSYFLTRHHHLRAQTRRKHLRLVTKSKYKVRWLKEPPVNGNDLSDKVLVM